MTYSSTNVLEGYESINAVSEMEKILVQEMADSIDKEIVNELFRLGRDGLYEKTVSRIKQTIREQRLGKILDKDD